MDMEAAREIQEDLEHLDDQELREKLVSQAATEPVEPQETCMDQQDPEHVELPELTENPDTTELQEGGEQSEMRDILGCREDLELGRQEIMDCQVTRDPRAELELQEAMERRDPQELTEVTDTMASKETQEIQGAVMLVLMDFQEQEELEDQEERGEIQDTQDPRDVHSTAMLSAYSRED